jgi:hypothetical protein
VRQLSCRSGLAKESLSQIRLAGEMVRQDLQRYWPVKLDILGEVDDSHATTPQLRIQ